MNPDLVKSVFKAPVPAYCLAQASALFAQAACEQTGKGTEHKQEREIEETDHIIIYDLNFKCAR